MKYRVTYYDTRNDEWIVLEFMYRGQAVNAMNALKYLSEVEQISWERI